MKRAMLAAVVAFELGCIALTPKQRREENLMREARTFADDLRWARYEQVTNAMPRDEAQRFAGRVSLVRDDLVIADHEVTSIKFAPGSEAATVAVQLQWYTQRDPTLRTTLLEQQWESRDGAWLVVKQRRVRGERFPLTTEPTSPAPPNPSRP